VSDFEIRKLSAQKSKKLVLHALEKWHSQGARDPEPLLNALKNEDLEVVKTALSLGAVPHPKICCSAIVSMLGKTDPLWRKIAVESLRPEMGEGIREQFKKFLVG